MCVCACQIRQDCLALRLMRMKGNVPKEEFLEVELSLSLSVSLCLLNPVVEFPIYFTISLLFGNGTSDSDKRVTGIGI